MYEPNGGTVYEFIELKNTGPATLDLTGVRFTDGISFLFPSMLLGPGEEVVVVGDLVAFESRYGTGLNVAGVFGGNLNNGGEEVVLTLPEPFDAAILRFEYRESWYPSSAGPGFSLELRDPSVPARDWNRPESWQASSTIDGSPGGAIDLIPDDFPGWLAFYSLGPLEDADDDGLVALVEYSLGLDPTLNIGANGPASLPVASRSPAGRLAISFHLPVNGAAADGCGANEIVYTVESSDDLLDWIPLMEKTETTSFTGTGTAVLDPPFNGRVPVTITDDQNHPGHRFIRLRMSWLP